MKMPTKLFTPKTIDGKSLAPMMKALARITQIIYTTYPDFVALIPFGSRTKGLASDDSDLDMFLVFEEAHTFQIIEAEITIRDLLFELYPDLDVQILSRSRGEYELELKRGGKGTHEVNLSYFGNTVGPHRLKETHNEIRTIVLEERKKILHLLEKKARQNELSYFRNHDIYDDELIDPFVGRRVALWKKRCKNILAL